LGASAGPSFTFSTAWWPTSPSPRSWRKKYFCASTARASYEPAAKFTTWLFRIATHIALNHLRDRKSERALGSLDAEDGGARTRQIADARPNMEQTLLRRVQRDRVREAIQGERIFCNSIDGIDASSSSL
jgi:hypothetical protein